MSSSSRNHDRSAAPAIFPRPRGETGGAPDRSRLREELDTLSPQLDVLLGRIEEFEVERVVLPRYIAPLRRLLPLVPELAELDEGALRALQLETVALVLDTDDDRVIETLRVALTEVLGERFELVAVRVDPHAVGCVIASSHRETEAVHTMLGRERVRAVPLPSGYEEPLVPWSGDRDG